MFKARTFKLKSKFLLWCSVIVFLFIVIIPKDDSKEIKKFALLSCNTDDFKKYFYIFYLPITAQAWRLVGYEPIVFLISSNSTLKNKHRSAANKYLKRLNVTIIEVESDPDYQVITAMVSRLLIGLIDDKIVSENDFVITSDSDLIPIKKLYYDKFNSNKINLWNHDCCGSFFYNRKLVKMYPMGHIGMKKKLWRDLFDLNGSETLCSQSVFSLIKKYFNETLIKKNRDIKRGDSTWFLDQSIFAVALHQFVEKGIIGRKKLIPYEGKRLDRINTFDFKIKTKDFTDFHAFHGDLKNNLSLFNFAIEQIFDRNTYDFINDYYKEFF